MSRREADAEVERVLTKARQARLNTKRGELAVLIKRRNAEGNDYLRQRISDDIRQVQHTIDWMRSHHSGIY